MGEVDPLLFGGCEGGEDEEDLFSSAMFADLEAPPALLHGARAVSRSGGRGGRGMSKALKSGRPPAAPVPTRLLAFSPDQLTATTTLSSLRLCYLHGYGKDTTSNNRQWLLRRLAILPGAPPDLVAAHAHHQSHGKAPLAEQAADAEEEGEAEMLFGDAALAAEAADAVVAAKAALRAAPAPQVSARGMPAAMQPRGEGKRQVKPNRQFQQEDRLDGQPVEHPPHHRTPAGTVGAAARHGRGHQMLSPKHAPLGAAAMSTSHLPALCRRGGSHSAGSGGSELQGGAVLSLEAPWDPELQGEGSFPSGGMLLDEHAAATFGAAAVAARAAADRARAAASSVKRCASAAEAAAAAAAVAANGGAAPKGPRPSTTAGRAALKRVREAEQAAKTAEAAACAAEAVAGEVNLLLTPKAAPPPAVHETPQTEVQAPPPPPPPQPLACAKQPRAKKPRVMADFVTGGSEEELSWSDEERGGTAQRRRQRTAHAVHARPPHPPRPAPTRPAAAHPFDLAFLPSPPGDDTECEEEDPLDAFLSDVSADDDHLQLQHHHSSDADALLDGSAADDEEDALFATAMDEYGLLGHADPNLPAGRLGASSRRMQQRGGGSSHGKAYAPMVGVSLHFEGGGDFGEDDEDEETHGLALGASRPGGYGFAAPAWRVKVGGGGGKPSSGGPSRKGGLVPPRKLLTSPDGFAKKSKQHNPWALEEAEALVEGVARCGGGRWADIKKLNYPAIAHRTAVDLKDKWRNLLRIATLPGTPASSRGGNSGGGGSMDKRREVPSELLARVRLLAASHGKQRPVGGAKAARGRQPSCAMEIDDRPGTPDSMS